MIEEPVFLDQGTYGCVHKPSLRCKDGSKIKDYTGKVSKIMLNRDSDTEFREYDKVKRADPKKNFFLGEPERCKPADIEINTKSLFKCKNNKKMIENMDNYSLLIMKNGGPNLTRYSDILLARDPTPENVIKFENFIFDVGRLLV